MTASCSSDPPARPADERLLAVPNLSEGADPGIVAELRSSLGPRVALLDEHSDAVHNRTVFTIAGDEAALLPALLRLARTAIERIDLTRQRGAHPRIGALDVCPIVWHDAGAAAARHRPRTGGRRAARRRSGCRSSSTASWRAAEERRERAYFRRGGHVELTRRMREGDLDARLRARSAAPDRRRGPGHRAPAAGRLQPRARAGRRARGRPRDRRRAARGGRRAAGVRALAIELAPGRIQISTNVHDPIAVPLAGSSPPYRSWPATPREPGRWRPSSSASSPRPRSRATPTTCRSPAPIRDAHDRVPTGRRDRLTATSPDRLLRGGR